MFRWTLLIVMLCEAFAFRNVFAAGWVAQGPEGVDVVLISSGTTIMVADRNGGSMMKIDTGWRNTGISGVKTIFADPYYKTNFIGTELSLHEEVEETLYDTGVCIEKNTINECTEWYFGSGVSGVARRIDNNSFIYVVSSDHQLFVAQYNNSMGGWFWSKRTPWNIPVPLLVGKTSDNRIVVANGIGVFIEDSVGSETFQQIATLSISPQKIITFGNDVYLINSFGEGKKIFLSGGWQEVSIGSVRDITADNLRVYILTPLGIYKTYDGVSLTAVNSPSVYVNSLVVRDNSLYAGTTSGLSALDLAPPTSVVNVSIIGSSISVSWGVVSGAAGYRLYYGANTVSQTQLDMGNVTNVTVPLSGVNVVRVGAYNMDGYESKSDYKWVCNPVDITVPQSITNLSVTPNSDSAIIAEWTEPSDNFAVASFEVRYSLSLITARNWGLAKLATNAPVPTGAGSAKKLTIKGLAPNTPYYVGVRTKDSCGRMSVLYNAKLTQTLPSKMRNILFAWESAEDAVGYDVCCGMISGFYTSCAYIGVANQGWVQFEDDNSPRYCATKATSNLGEHRFSNELIIP